MALGKCRECGKQVAKSAKTCPSCGVDKPVKPGVTFLQGLGVVVGLVVLSRLCGTGTKPSTAVTAAAITPEVPAAAPQPEQPKPAAQPVKHEKLTAAALLQAYSANEVAADAKYKGKRFKFSGIVTKIESGLTDEPQVWLGSPYQPVVARGLGKAFAATLSKGETMLATCTVEGEVIGMPQIDCSGPQDP